MSSILASLDMSLDDIISTKKTDSRGNKNNANRAKGPQKAGAVSSGPIRGGRSSNRRRHQPYARRAAQDEDEMMDVEEDTPVSTRKVAASKRKAVVVKKQDKGNKKSSILSRLGKASGGAAATAQAGTKILVKNLKYDILEEDVTELFGTVGKVTKAEIVYDRSGRSKGLARVWYARRADAEKAIKEYDGRTLDGQPMQISLDSDKNVRNGLFGTALAGGDNNNNNVKFNVSFGGRGGQKGRRGGRGNRGGQATPKTTEDLDNEMDSYMKDA